MGTDPGEFVEFLVAPAYLRLLLLDRPLDDELLEHSVRATIAAYAIKPSAARNPENPVPRSSVRIGDRCTGSPASTGRQ